MKQIYLECTLNHMFNILKKENEVQEIVNNSIIKKINSIRYFILKS
jgi:hypothetical protein